MIESRIEPVVTRESSDASSPVDVTIQPAEQPIVVVPTLREERAQERTVHVHIGAIEIFGTDSPSQLQANAAPAAAAPTAAIAAATSSGFEEYAALRTYTSWAW
jgi:hypothetical protein